MEEKLKQLRHLQKEIDLLKERLHKLENMVIADVVVGSWPNFPYIEQRQLIKGVPHVDMEKVKRRLKQRIAQLVKLQDELLEWINRIDDSEIRQILMLRYMEGLSWQAVARKLGTIGDGSTERKKVNRFLGKTG